MVHERSGGGTRHDPAQIRAVARMMFHELNLGNGPGTLSDLKTRGQISGSAFGAWDTAQALHKTVTVENRQITTVYENFLHELQQVAEDLMDTAANYGLAGRSTRENIAAAEHTVN